MTTSRVVVITGASSGIGRATAHAASAAGDHVVLVARGRRSLEEAATECKEHGAESVTVAPADVGDDAAVAAVFSDVMQMHGRVDAVLHCAGVVAYGRTEDVPTEVFDAVLRTNVIGAVNVSRHAVQQMRNQRYGSLVLIGSVIGHVAVPKMSPYVLSKHCVRVLARQLRIENRDRPGLTIAYVAPGGVDTPIYREAGTYSGFHGRPPPPVASPERIAALVLERIGREHARAQTSLVNDVMRFGFTVTPRLFDALVGPLFEIAAMDRTRPADPSPGNVLESAEDGYRLHGGHGHVVVGIARNVVQRINALVGEI